MAGTRSLHDCQTLVNAVTAAQGRVPAVLGYILTAGALLDTHSVSSDPAKALVDAAVAGTLTEKSLTLLIAEAATKQSIANCAGDLRQRIAPMLAGAFIQALKAGGADEILRSLSKPWNEAAEQIAVARSLINPESDPSHILDSGEPGTIEAWGSLRKHISVVNTIGSIASSFGPRSATFPMLAEFSLGETSRIEDRAVMCCCGPSLEADSAAFRQPDPIGHRTSPWFRVQLHLNSIAEATERYRIWAEQQWSAAHPNPVIQQQRPDGSVAEVELVNPYRQQQEANA